MKLVDFVVPGSITGATLEANGYDGAIRYLGGWGRLTAAERDDLTAHGRLVGLVFEQNEGDPLQGAAKGEAVARAAVAEARTLFPDGGGVLFWACDTDPRRNRNAVIDAYRAWSPIVRASNNLSGGYIGDDPGVALLDEGTLDRLWQPGASSWSAEYPSPRAHIVQTVGQPVALGADYDHNDVQSIPVGLWGEAPDPARLEEENDVYFRIYTANDAVVPWYLTWLHPLLGRRVKVAIDKPTADAWAVEQVFNGVPNVYQSIDAAGAHPWLTAKANIDGLPDVPASAAVKLTDAQLKALGAQVASAVPTPGEIAKVVNDDAAARLAG